MKAARTFCELITWCAAAAVAKTGGVSSSLARAGGPALCSAERQWRGSKRQWKAKDGSYRRTGGLVAEAEASLKPAWTKHRCVCTAFAPQSCCERAQTCACPRPTPDALRKPPSTRSSSQAVSSATSASCSRAPADVSSRSLVLVAAALIKDRRTLMEPHAASSSAAAASSSCSAAPAASSS